jgi:hypothetical protein
LQIFLCYIHYNLVLLEKYGAYIPKKYTYLWFKSINRILVSLDKKWSFVYILSFSEIHVNAGSKIFSVMRRDIMLKLLDEANYKRDQQDIYHCKIMVSFRPGNSEINVRSYKRILYVWYRQLGALHSTYCIWLGNIAGYQSKGISSFQVVEHSLWLFWSVIHIPIIKHFHL